LPIGEKKGGRNIMMFEFLEIAIGVAVSLLLLVAILKFVPKSVTRPPIEVDEKELEAAERALKKEGELDWVVLKRCHGPAYNHAVMTEIISTLNAGGVTATYDVVASSSVDGGVTNYMLKVLRGDEEKSLEILGQ
jgi:hypothetical protein